MQTNREAIDQFKKKDIHTLFEQGHFAVVDTGVLHQTPVNYYLLARKD